MTSRLPSSECPKTTFVYFQRWLISANKYPCFIYDCIPHRARVRIIDYKTLSESTILGQWSVKYNKNFNTQIFSSFHRTQKWQNCGQLFKVWFVFRWTTDFIEDKRSRFIWATIFARVQPTKSIIRNCTPLICLAMYTYMCTPMRAPIYACYLSPIRSYESSGVLAKELWNGSGCRHCSGCRHLCNSSSWLHRSDCRNWCSDVHESVQSSGTSIW